MLIESSICQTRFCSIICASTCNIHKWQRISITWYTKIAAQIFVIPKPEFFGHVCTNSPSQSTTIWGGQPAVNGRKSCLTTQSDPILTTRFPWLLWEVCLGNVVKPQWLSCWLLKDFARNFQLCIGKVKESSIGDVIVNLNWRYSELKLVVPWCWRFSSFYGRKHQTSPQFNKSKSELQFTKYDGWLF